MPSFDAQFWAAFWPGLLSTLVGIVLGIPAGLFLASLIRRSEGAGVRRAERERLIAAPKTLSRALEANRTQLATLGGLKQGTVVTAPVLNTVAWDAVKLDVVSYLRDPALQADLGDHFVEIEDVRRLNNQYLELTIGLASALASAGANREVLRTHIVARATKLVAAIDELRPRISAAISNR